MRRRQLDFSLDMVWAPMLRVLADLLEVTLDGVEIKVERRPLERTIEVPGTEPGEPGAAGGGNATAANRIVNAIPAVCAAPPGPVSPVDLPPITGAAQLGYR